MKRLFKSRAKKLIERAESLTNNHFESILGDYGLESNEEEKEVKIPKPTKEIINLRPASKSADFSIEVGLDSQESRSANIVAKGKEDKKGEISEEEFKKAKDNKSKCCGVKRSKSFSNKEELEHNLKDFTCTICMDYMVGAKKLQ